MYSYSYMFPTTVIITVEAHTSAGIDIHIVLWILKPVGKKEDLTICCKQLPTQNSFLHVVVSNTNYMYLPLISIQNLILNQLL